MKRRLLIILGFALLVSLVYLSYQLGRSVERTEAVRNIPAAMRVAKATAERYKEGSDLWLLHYQLSVVYFDLLYLDQSLNSALDRMLYKLLEKRFMPNVPNLEQLISYRDEFRAWHDK